MSQPDPWLLCDPYCAQFKCYHEKETEMNENEEPPVTETELARVLELDAKATQGPFFISESYGDVSVMADDDGRDPWTICHMADPLGYDGVEQRMSNAEAYVQYRSITPRLARELAAARAAIKVAREAIEKAPHEYGNQTCNDAGNLVKRDGFWVTGRCTCWKSAALAQLNTHTHE